MIKQKLIIPIAKEIYCKNITKQFCGKEEIIKILNSGNIKEYLNTINPNVSILQQKLILTYID